jgi:hypothetical protein
VLIFGLASMTAVPLASGGLLLTGSRRDSAFQREAALREDLPLASDDLRPSPPVPATQNAGPTLKALTFHYRTLGESLDGWRKATDILVQEPLHSAAEREFRDSLDIHAAMIRLAEAATEFPRCDFAYDWHLGQNLQFPELAVIRHFARVFACRSVLAPTPEMAFVDIARGAWLGTLVAQTPSAVHLLLGSRLHTVAHRAYIAALTRFGACSAAHSARKAFAPLPPLEFALRGEMVASLVMLQQLRTGQWDTKESDAAGCGESASLQMLSDVAPVAGDRWEGSLLRYWRQIFAVLRATAGDDDAREAQLAALEGTWFRSQVPLEPLTLTQIPYVGWHLYGLVGPAESRLYPQLSWAPDRYRAHAAERHLRESAVNLLEERMRTGTFPTNPSLPRDPFAKGPLQYRRETDGCTLWSVGPDRADEGDIGLPPDRKERDRMVRL